MYRKWTILYFSSLFITKKRVIRIRVFFTNTFVIFTQREKREIEGVRATYFCDETIPGLKMGLLGVRDYGDGGGKVYHFSLTGLETLL